ncbi:hypothetical protein X975_16970, partial [Stegodyphus mimosarum]
MSKINSKYESILRKSSVLSIQATIFHKCFWKLGHEIPGTYF